MLCSILPNGVCVIVIFVSRIFSERDDIVQGGYNLLGVITAYFSVSHRHLDSGMTKKPRNGHNVYPSHYGVASKRMTKSVEMKRFFENMLQTYGLKDNFLYSLSSGKEGLRE